MTSRSARCGALEIIGETNATDKRGDSIADWKMSVSTRSSAGHWR
jgi:hypothetical protein